MNELAGAFGLGVISAASPCLLPLYPIFIAYLSSNSRQLAGRRASGLLGTIVLAGVLTTMLAVGLLLATLAIPTSLLLAVLSPAVDALLVILGVLLLADRNPFERLPGLAVPIVANPYLQAYIYGVLLGPIALPCAGAFVVVLFAISVGLQDTLAKVVTFVIYGLGFGLPLVVLSFLAVARSQALVRGIVRHHDKVNRLAGAILITVGILDFNQNLPSLALTLGL